MRKQITEAKTNKSHMWIYEKLAFSIDFKHTYVCNFGINSEIEFYKEFCIDVEEAIDFYFPCMQPIYLNFLLLSEANSIKSFASMCKRQLIFVFLVCSLFISIFSCCQRFFLSQQYQVFSWTCSNWRWPFLPPLGFWWTKRSERPVWPKCPNGNEQAMTARPPLGSFASDERVGRRLKVS